MKIITSWEQMSIAQGMTQGIAQSKETLVVRQLRRRLGTVPADISAKLDIFTPEQIDDLGEALLDFHTVADLQQWLDQH